MPTSDLVDFHHDIDGRRVDVRFLSAPVRVLSPGLAVYELRSVSGRAHLEDEGSMTKLIVGTDFTIPLERVREIDADSRPFFSALGGGIGLASAVAYGIIEAKLPDQSRRPCDFICDDPIIGGVLFSLVSVPIGGAIGYAVGKGSHWVFVK